MFDSISNFYLDQVEPQKSCLLTLRDLILEQDINITETIKYGMPCFCYKKKMFCYLWVENTTKEPYILMVEGKYLNHILLEQETRSRMKILRINPTVDIDSEIIKTILQDALDLYRSGVIKA